LRLIPFNFNNDQSASPSARELQRRVSERFGALPNFFRLSPETPEITEKLWGFAQQRIWITPSPLFLRNDCSSIFLDFVPSATASPAIPVS
jgi:hypothetical protein